MTLKITRTLGPGYVKVNIQLYDLDKWNYQLHL